MRINCVSSTNYHSNLNTKRNNSKLNISFGQNPAKNIMLVSRNLNPDLSKTLEKVMKKLLPEGYSYNFTTRGFEFSDKGQFEEIQKILSQHNIKYEMVAPVEREKEKIVHYEPKFVRY